MVVKIVPTGGLGNRMRAIASGIAIAHHYDVPAKVYWNIRSGLHAEFSDLFKPLQEPSVELFTNTSWLYNIEFRKEHLLRLPFLRLGAKNILFNHDIYREHGRDIFQILGDSLRGNVVLVSGCTMCKIEDMSRLFVPVDEIQDAIDRVVTHFSENTIGVHIRRTDNKQSIAQSPLDSFYALMDKYIAEDDNVKFYLATDDDEVKSEMVGKYAERIITQYDKTERKTLEGMKFAVNDMYCLSKTKKIIGSVYSSYSSIAAELGGIEVEYAKK